MSTNIVTYRTPVGPLEGLQRVSRVWVRVSQICDTLQINRATFYRIVERDPSVVPEGQTELVPWPSEGGEQPTRAYTLRVLLNVAMEVNNKRARRIRRWLVDLLDGKAPVPRVQTDPMARLPEAREALAHPMVRAALTRLEQAEAMRAEAMRSYQRQMTEASRLARGAGFSTKHLHKFRQLERLLAELPVPSLAAQPALPLDADPSAA